MKFYDIPLIKGGDSYSLSPFFGHLMKSAVLLHSSASEKNPSKLESILYYCLNPYELGSFCAPIKAKDAGVDHKAAAVSLDRILRLCRCNFWLAWRYASSLEPRFENAREAIEFFNERTSHLNQNALCLPRSLFSAAQSQTFSDNGAILIGVFLPSRSMHAWIIEKGCQPDQGDRVWVNYRPIAALC